jgi:hypothetical protein
MDIVKQIGSVKCNSQDRPLQDVKIVKATVVESPKA